LTTESIPASLQGHRAGFVSRAAAAAVDLLVVGLIAAGAYAVMVALSFVISPRRFSWPRPAPVASLGFYFVATTIYLALGWIATGRTFGKQLVGLRIVAQKGTRVRPGVALARAFLCAVFPAGLIWCVFSYRNSSLHDLMFNTMVIYDWSSRTPPRAGPLFGEERGP
jgi:uncharacterized RDD family membrane protein YckC